MKTNRQPPMRKESSNDFQTPPKALKPLIQFLKKEWTIWECAEGEGNLSTELFNKGFNVVSSDINNKNDGFFSINSYNNIKQNTLKRYFEKDFLNWKPEKWDCIITNPPFSLKQEFLERCYKLGKPFALLLPLTTFETKKRQDLFKKYGVQVIFFNKRINFKTPSGKGSG